jgi:hypothetical protein
VGRVTVQAGPGRHGRLGLDEHCRGPPPRRPGRQPSEGANVQRVRRVRSGDDIHPRTRRRVGHHHGVVDRHRPRERRPSDMPPRSGLIDRPSSPPHTTGDTRQPNEHTGRSSWPPAGSSPWPPAGGKPWALDIKIEAHAHGARPVVVGTSQRTAILELGRCPPSGRRRRRLCPTNSPRGWNHYHVSPACYRIKHRYGPAGGARTCARFSRSHRPRVMRRTTGHSSMFAPGPG